MVSCVGWPAPGPCAGSCNVCARSLGRCQYRACWYRRLCTLDSYPIKSIFQYDQMYTCMEMVLVVSVIYTDPCTYEINWHINVVEFSAFQMQMCSTGKVPLTKDMGQKYWLYSG
jgi:hypothetical protein